MVKRAAKAAILDQRSFREGSRSAKILLSEVIAAGTRFEASAFGIEAHSAVEALKASGFPLQSLFGTDGFCNGVNDIVRFRRVYVDSAHGVPFLSSSDIISMRPQIENYLSRKLTKNIDKLLVKRWEVLISRSGTVGNVALAGETLEGKALSEHSIRLSADAPEKAGFAAAFLRSRYGRPQLTGASYGSVVVHIEPSHLKRVLIPQIHPIHMTEIGEAMCHAATNRDEANRLLDEADLLLHERLRLPRLSQAGQHQTLRTHVSAAGLQQRFDASFHDRLAYTALEQLRSLNVQLTTLSDPRVLKEIRPITKFRKRVYVPKGGIPLYGGKQLFQIDPIDVKGLARGAHTKDLKEIALAKDMILVTCSGTVGRVQIIPKYMDGWTANQHATRLISAEDMHPGYVFAWLASDYGSKLVKRNAYGSVILEIDKEMFGAVSIPLPEVAIRNEIGDLVSRANELRNAAWTNEQDAIKRLEALISNQEH